MKEKLTNNGVLKLISVGLALFLWLLVINEDNPIETKSLTIYNVEYLNADVVLNSGQTYTVENLKSKGVDIKVKIRRQDSGKVRNSDFKAIVDLAQVGPYGYAEVKVEWLGGSGQYDLKEEDISWTTKTVKVTLEDIEEFTYSVGIKITGEPAEDYIVGEAVAEPRTVDIRAPKSVAEKIRSVGIEVSVDGMNTEVTGTAKLKLYDVSGAELKLDYDSFEDYEFSLSAEQIAYTIPLLKIKEVYLRTNGYTGKVAEGYRYTGMEMSAQEAYVAGRRLVLADVDFIDIPAEALNLEGATQNVEVQIDLSKYVPEGVTIEGNRLVTITLFVEPLISERRELVPSQIRLENGVEGRKYTLQSPVMVTIRGLREDLNTLTRDMIDAWISLENLEAGTHTVEVYVTVDSGFEVVKVTEATVLVEEILETEEDPEGSTEETTEDPAGEDTTQESTEEETTESSGDVDADVTVESTEGLE